MSSAIPPLPLYAFMSRTGTTLPLLYDWYRGIQSSTTNVFKLIKPGYVFQLYGHHQAYHYYAHRDFLYELFVFRNSKCLCFITPNAWIVGSGRGEGRCDHGVL
jgi:hypothetical protein